VRRTVPPSAEIEARIEHMLSVGVGENPRESPSELARLGARLIIQRAVEDEFDAWLGRAHYERRLGDQREKGSEEGRARSRRGRRRHHLDGSAALGERPRSHVGTAGPRAAPGRDPRSAVWRQGNIARVGELIDRGAQDAFPELVGWSPWVFASPQETERRLRAAGFSSVRCWLEDRPTYPRGHRPVCPHLDPGGTPRTLARRKAECVRHRRRGRRAPAAGLRAAERLRCPWTRVITSPPRRTGGRMRGKQGRERTGSLEH
jgi:hypothetical protein